MSNAPRISSTFRAHATAAVRAPVRATIVVFGSGLQFAAALALATGIVLVLEAFAGK